MANMSKRTEYNGPHVPMTHLNMGPILFQPHPPAPPAPRLFGSKGQTSESSFHPVNVIVHGFEAYEWDPHPGSRSQFLSYRLCDVGQVSSCH